MKYAFLVAVREYMENVRTKGFWFGILLFPLMLTAAMFVPQFLEEKATPSRHFILVDFSEELEPVIEKRLDRFHNRRLLQALQEYASENVEKPDAADVDLDAIPADALDPEKIVDRLADSQPEALDAFSAQGGKEFFLAQLEPYLDEEAPEFVEPRRRFVRAPLPDDVSSAGSVDAAEDALRAYLTGERSLVVDGDPVSLFAAVIIAPDAIDKADRPNAMTLPTSGSEPIRYWSVNLADTDLKEQIEAAVNVEIRRREYLARGVDAGTVREIERTSIPVASLNPKKAVGKERVSVADQLLQWAPVGFVYLLWVSIFSVAQMLLNNTIEEKSNRIIEVLLSSVTPLELMMGKLLGIAMVGMTMLLFWIGSLLGVLKLTAGSEMEWAGQLLDVVVGSGLLPAFIVYFVFGFLLYSGVFLAIGSVCNTLKEAQNFMGTVMLIMMVPLFTMVFIPRDPHGTLAVVMSWIPLYTPFAMMNRAGADPPMFEVVGTFVLLVLSTAGMLWLAAKIFRRGILRTGQPPKLLEMLRWVRTTD